MSTSFMVRVLGAACLASTAAGGCVGGDEAGSSQSELQGAVFTTTADGSRVDENIYESKEDVYLDGGPGPNAPAGAAALPEGSYYFQVTDPSGKTLLSTDPIECRMFHIGEDGTIVGVTEAACAHATGVDSDHGGVTVQLMPYDDTPNPGGEYKMWVTSVEDYAEGEGVHGFVHRYTKTDNFKVRAQVEPEPEPEPDAGPEPDAAPEPEPEPDAAPEPEPEPDAGPAPVCGDLVVDETEQCDDGNTVNGDGCSDTCTIETSL